MFKIFKKPAQYNDLSWLGPDIHSHLLPGLDDGAPDIHAALSLVEGLAELGIQQCFTTPHIFKELYPNNRESIAPALELLKSAIQQKGWTMQIDAAAEYMIDEHFDPETDLICLPKKHVLIEMSYLNESPSIEQVIFDLHMQGYKTILAHPERYLFYHNDRKRYTRFKDMGVLFQLNILSITGYYGKEVKRVAEYLYERGLYDVVGTDLHHDNHLRALSKVVKTGKLFQKIGSYPFKNKQLFSGFHNS